MKREPVRPRYSGQRTGDTLLSLPEDTRPSESPFLSRLFRGYRVFPRDIYKGIKQRLELGGLEPASVTNLAGYPNTSATFLSGCATFTQVPLASGVTGTLPIANGGTGQTTATAAFNALDPLTTKGDVLAHNGTDSMRVAVGASNTVLTADSTASTGVSWVAPAAGGTHDILSATHTDSFASVVVRGGIIVANSTPKWAQVAIGASARHLRSDGVDPSWQLVNAALDLTGATPIANGGTGATTATAAFNALDPLTTKGDIVVNNGTDSMRVAVGASNTILTADATASTGVSWLTPATQTSEILASAVHTDTVTAAVARGAMIVGNSTPKWDRLQVGSLTKPHKVIDSDGTDATWVRNQGAAVYVPTTADDAINSVTDVTIETRDVTDVSAGDQVVMEGSFTIVNDSTATRVYVITMDFDAAFDCEFSTGALATSATIRHQFYFRAVCDIRSTSLAYGTFFIWAGPAAGVVSGGDVTMGASELSGSSWGTSGSNLTGTLTCALFIRSASATATQTCRLHNFVVRKFTPLSL